MQQVIGQMALRELLKLNVPAPAVQSFAIAGARRTEIGPERIIEFYPRAYIPEGSIESHIKFALRHEPTDIGVLAATFKAMDEWELIRWVQRRALNGEVTS